MQPSLNEVALQGGTGGGDRRDLAAGHRRRAELRARPHPRLGDRARMHARAAARARDHGRLELDDRGQRRRRDQVGQGALRARRQPERAATPATRATSSRSSARRIEVDGREVAIEDVVHLGLMAFSAADNQQLLVELRPVHARQLRLGDGPAHLVRGARLQRPVRGLPAQLDLPAAATRIATRPFVRTTRSFMPACNQTPSSTSCVGQIAEHVHRAGPRVRAATRSTRTGANRAFRGGRDDALRERADQRRPDLRGIERRAAAARGHGAATASTPT